MSDCGYYCHIFYNKISIHEITVSLRFLSLCIALEKLVLDCAQSKDETTSDSKNDLWCLWGNMLLTQFEVHVTLLL